MGCSNSKVAAMKDEEKTKEELKQAKALKDVMSDYKFTITKEEKEQLNKKIIIFLIGGPGSGKGTQSERIIKDFDTGYMSAGDLLRKESDKGTSIGKFILEQMKQGAIVPQEIILNLLKDEILSQNKKLYLIDGFPRKTDQAETFESQICQCKCALFLDVPDDILINRLIKRSETSGRADDNPETIKKRIKTFHDVSEQVFNHFDKLGRAVKIDGNRDPDVVYEEVHNLIQKILDENQ